MAEQAAKLIDISRSYVPMDPNSFPESMHATGGEDSPEGRIPVIPYDGYNFMPTAYGYMSYFGVQNELGIDALVSRCDDLFFVQTTMLQNILVALCEDGIWTKDSAAAGAWTNIIALAVPAAGLHNNWTKCIIGNNVYMYRAGGANAYVMNQGNSFVPTAFTPTHLNMAAQQGIFKAGARLAFWDSANSISWGNPDNAADHVPSLETGVGATVFQQIVGKIVNVRQHGDGFVIYATRSIVHVRRTADAYMFWNANAIFTENGISYLNECVHGQPDTIHFAYTTFGIVKIQDGQADYIIPEVFTFLKESRQPVYLRLLEGRYLFFQFLDERYVGGIPNFSIEVVEGSTLEWAGAAYAAENISENPCIALHAVDRSMESIFLFNTFGYTSSIQADGVGDVPIWEDHLSYIVPKAELEAFITHSMAGLQSPFEYFNATAFTKGAVARVDGGPTEKFIPASTPDLTYTFAPEMFIESNTHSFFNKQDQIWYWERQYMEAWRKAIYNKVHADSQIAASIYDTDPFHNLTTVAPVAVGTVQSIAYTYNTFGPYIDLSYFSEANKYYGWAEKSAWLQRSLTKAINVEVSSSTRIETDSPSYEAKWLVGANGPAGTPQMIWDTYALMVANAEADIRAAYAAANSGQDPGTLAVSETAGGSFFTGPGDLRGRRLDFTITGVHMWDMTIRPYDAVNAIGLSYTETPAYQPVFITPLVKIQSFNVPRFTTVDYDTCIYKELAFTQITGHGHYELDGSFTVDDTTDEAVDYVDICLSNPTKKKGPSLFNGISIPEGLGYSCLQDADGPVIDAVTYGYPAQSIYLPPGSFLMQAGSIEPIYPTFLGAYIYDLQYKKWGKMVQDHLQLLNYSPVNSHAGDQPIPYDIFSVSAGCLLPTGLIALFDKRPNTSIIKLGKLGYYRKGFTNGEEVRLQFRHPAEGTVTLEGSLDGKSIQPAISQIEAFSNEYEHTAHFSNSARWFNVVIEGYYDLKNVDFAGVRRGKR